MFCDHIGDTILGKFSFLNLIGRIAFPIFAFQVSQSYIHTKNLKKYMIRLLIFGIISQIPFMLFLTTFSEGFYLNIFFTMFLGLLAIFAFEKFNNKILGFFIVFIISVVAYLIRVDYGMFGVLLIFLFYFFRNNKIKMAITCTLLCFIKYVPNVISYPYLFKHYFYCAFFTAISIIFILSYNKKQGPKLKYIFYIFYPLHLLILYFINMALH